MKKNGFQFYLLVIISPGLGIAPPAPQGLSYPPRERTLPRTTIHDSLQQLFHPFLIIISSSPFSVCLPSLGDNLHRVLVPSAKSVHNQRNEYDSLCLASFTVFPHFDIEGMLDSVFFLTGDLSSKLLLKGSILAQRESRTSAGRSSLPGRSPAGSFRGPRAS